MSRLAAALPPGSARLVAVIRSSAPGYARASLIVAAMLIAAAAMWLALEVFRAWAAEPPRSAERGDRAPTATEHALSPLLPQLVEEIARLNAQVALLRDACEQRDAPLPTREPTVNDAELMEWARAHREAYAAEREWDPRGAVGSPRG